MCFLCGAVEDKKLFSLQQQTLKILLFISQLQAQHYVTEQCDSSNKCQYKSLKCSTFFSDDRIHFLAVQRSEQHL